MGDDAEAQAHAKAQATRTRKHPSSSNSSDGVDDDNDDDGDNYASSCEEKEDDYPTKRARTGKVKQTKSKSFPVH
jgi:hypothetical protein